MKMKRPVLLALTLLLAASAVLSGCKQEPENIEQPPETTPSQPLQTEDAEQITEDPGVPFVTDYIILSYPVELEDAVSIRYEQLEDGQQIIFSTDFTGEELELFRFSLSKSGTDGYQLGTLLDDTAGELIVCVEVTEYTNGSWTPEEYARLTAMQERVNDIIIQFHEDPRFTPVR